MEEKTVAAAAVGTTMDGIPTHDLVAAMLDGSLPEKLEALGLEGSETVGGSMAQLQSQGTADVIEYLLGIQWTALPQRQKWILQHTLQSFAEQMKTDLSRTFVFFHEVRKAAGADARYYLDQGFVGWCSVNPSLLRGFAASIASGKEDAPYLHALLVHLHAIEPDEAFAVAVDFTDDQRPDVKRQAISALAGFDLSDQNQADAVEARVLELIGSTDAGVARSAILAACQLIRRPGQAYAGLLEILQRDDLVASAEGRRALTIGLLGQPKMLPPPLDRTLTALVRRLSLDDQEDVSLLNQWLYHTDIDVDRHIVLEVLNAVIANSSDGWSFQGVHGFRHRDTGQGGVLGWYVIRWLLDGTHRTRDNLHELFAPLDSSIHQFSLSGMGLRDADVHYLARKVFAYLMFSHGPAVSMLCAFLIELKGAGKKDLEDFVATFWLRNFPADLELFDAYSKQHPKSRLKASIQRIRSGLDAYLGPLKALPPNPALRPSSLERRVQAEIAHDRSKEIRRNADRGSIFSQLMQKSVLLYGRSSVSYMQTEDPANSVRQVVPLHTFETSMAVPSMDVLAPARLMHLLYRFRSEARPK